MAIRRRLSSQESREAALEAARALLIESGPQSVTVKAVATRVGRTHANIIHHFGSAEGLQKALAAHIAQAVSRSIAQAVEASRNGTGTIREAVDVTFDGFGREGGAALVSWMVLSNNEEALQPIRDAIHDLVDSIYPGELAGSDNRIMHQAALTLNLLALGDAIMGDSLSRSLGVARDSARERAAAMIAAALEQAVAPY